MKIACQCRAESLDSELAEKIQSVLAAGGLCILPSDSSYILTGYLSEPGVSEDLNTLLERNGTKMSLAFGSLAQINERMSLSAMAGQFIESLSPKGLTFVAKPVSRAFQQYSVSQLHADGTVGLRLTGSRAETRLAEDYPLPTAPIRDRESKEVVTADRAVRIMEERMERYGIDRPIALVEGTVPFPGRWSTVVKEVKHDGLWRIVLLRENAIPLSEIERTALVCGYTEVVRGVEE